MTTVINDWAKILDNRGQVDTFILDFEKAFDTPPHELLKSKLFSYGIGGKTLKWIDSFLCFRQQRVVVNAVKSDWAPVLSGVPQGTVLGPLLFSLYINDISSDIESEIRLFADDCVCYREIKDEKDTVKLQRDIDRLGSWARKWGMRFQPVKCNMMQLTRKRIKKIHASYTLEGTNLGNHIEKTSTLPAARCEQNFILNGIGKLYFFYNIFLSIRASIPVRTVL